MFVCFKQTAGRQSMITQRILLSLNVFVFDLTYWQYAAAVDEEWKFTRLRKASHTKKNRMLRGQQLCGMGEFVSITLPSYWVLLKFIVACLTLSLVPVHHSPIAVAALFCHFRYNSTLRFFSVIFPSVDREATSFPIRVWSSSLHKSS